MRFARCKREDGLHRVEVVESAPLPDVHPQDGQGRPPAIVRRRRRSCEIPSDPRRSVAIPCRTRWRPSQVGSSLDADCCKSPAARPWPANGRSRPHGKMQSARREAVASATSSRCRTDQAPPPRVRRTSIPGYPWPGPGEALHANAVFFMLLPFRGRRSRTLEAKRHPRLLLPSSSASLPSLGLRGFPTSAGPHCPCAVTTGRWMPAHIHATAGDCWDGTTDA